MLGLHVSPDLDSVLYALAGARRRGARLGSRRRDWNALETVAELGGESWFRLGDRDIGLHLVRTQLLREGATLSEATERIAHAFGLERALLPATDDPLRTFLETPAGTLPVPDVVRRARPPRRGRRRPLRRAHRGACRRPACSRRSQSADVIVIAPSNPYVSIGPILAVEEIRAALERAPRAVRRRQPAGRRSRGQGARPTACSRGSPAAPTPTHVAGCYAGLIDVLVVDERRCARRACPAASSDRRDARR